jgi:hypothetical protein
MWTAKKVNPRIEGLVYRVNVEFYKDGVLDHMERYETTQSQPENWPAELVKRRIQHLEELETFQVTAGDITLPADPVVDTAKEDWLADYSLASRAKMLVDLGVIPANNAKYVALLARLKTNFRPEYIGLI